MVALVREKHGTADRHQSSRETQAVRRRIPLFAGEKPGRIGILDTVFYTERTSIQTSIWLMRQTTELQRIKELEPGEHLVKVASNQTYAITDTGRSIAL